MKKMDPSIVFQENRKKYFSKSPKRAIIALTPVDQYVGAIRVPRIR
jgi:hypothetical protein